MSYHQALLLALCTLFALVSAENSCHYRLDVHTENSCEGPIVDCHQVGVSSSGRSCAQLEVVGTSGTYYSSMNCTMKQLELYTTEDCSGSALLTLNNHECEDLNSASLRLAFETTCSAATLLQSWPSILF